MKQNALHIKTMKSINTIMIILSPNTDIVVTNFTSLVETIPLSAYPYILFKISLNFTQKIIENTSDHIQFILQFQY